jgi:hypothetical protein
VNAQKPTNIGTSSKVTDMNSSVIRDALGELERQLEQLHEIRRQIEGFTMSGRSWEAPEEALPHFLNRLHENLLVVLEAADLPETRNRVAESWRRFEKTGGIGKTTVTPQYDYLESEPLEYLDTILDGLRMSVGSGINPAEAHELAKLETILRKTAVLLRNRKVMPQGEFDIQEVMHDYLGAFFTDYRHPIHITGTIKNFVPDGGVRNLKAAIEFKYAATKKEVAEALSGIFEDISGYKGSSDWSRFYTVVYQTESFESEDRFRSEMTRVGALSWMPILVTGGGARRKGKARSVRNNEKQRTE